MIDRTFADGLACPQCKGQVSVDRNGSVVRCDRCHLRFPVHDGFPILIADEAVPEPPPVPRRRRPPAPRG